MADSDSVVDGYTITVTANGAFGFRAIVAGVPGVSGTGKTADAAVAAVRTKLRVRLGKPALPVQAPPAASPEVSRRRHAPQAAKRRSTAPARATPTPQPPARPEPPLATALDPPKFRLLDLLAVADAMAPADFLECRRSEAAFASEFAAVSREIQARIRMERLNP